MGPSQDSARTRLGLVDFGRLGLGIYWGVKTRLDSDSKLRLGSTRRVYGYSRGHKTDFELAHIKPYKLAS